METFFPVLCLAAAAATAPLPISTPSYSLVFPEGWSLSGGAVRDTFNTVADRGGHSVTLVGAFFDPPLDMEREARVGAMMILGTGGRVPAKILDVAETVGTAAFRVTEWRDTGSQAPDRALRVRVFTTVQGRFHFGASLRYVPDGCDSVITVLRGVLAGLAAKDPASLFRGPHAPAFRGGAAGVGHDALGRRHMGPSAFLQYYRRYLTAEAGPPARSAGGGEGAAKRAGAQAACADTLAGKPPVTEAGRSSAAKLGLGGGRIAAVSSAGVAYTLEVPAGALLDSAEIRMTPVASMGGAPLAAGLLGAVQLEPSGLRFLKNATLRIAAGSALPGGKRLVGFSTNNAGGGFRLKPALFQGESVVLSVAHFSEAGAAAATPGEIEALPDLVPLASVRELTEEAIAIIGTRDSGASVEQIATILRRYHIEKVKPALEQSLLAADATAADGLTEYGAWLDLMEFAAAANNRSLADLRAALGKEDAEGKGLAADILKKLIAASSKRCAEKADLSEFAEASMWQETAHELGVATPAFGLDRNAFLRDACVRPVLDPFSLPTPLPAGTPKSLDVRARLIFQGHPNPFPGPFEFTVTAQRASLGTPKGFSDAEGRYTTVVTATGDPVDVSVRACAVLLGTSASDLCASGSASTRREFRYRGKVDFRVVCSDKDAEGPSSCGDDCRTREVYADEGSATLGFVIDHFGEISLTEAVVHSVTKSRRTLGCSRTVITHMESGSSETPVPSLDDRIDSLSVRLGVDGEVFDLDSDLACTTPNPAVKGRVNLQFHLLPQSVEPGSGKPLRYVPSPPLPFFCNPAKQNVTLTTSGSLDLIQ